MGYNLGMVDQADHVPVLVEEVVHLLSLRGGAAVVDCTLGLGGHALRLIPMIGPGGRYVGIDLDPGNLVRAKACLDPLAAASGVRFDAVQGNFRDLPDLLTSRDVEGVDVLLADLGFASSQMDDPARGFAFSADGPLDMRLDPEAPTTAADLVNDLPERDLADLIYQLGEERLSRKIARKIGEARRRNPIHSTGELADLVRRAYGGRGRQSRIDPATRTFMALRIAVNAELDALDELLLAVGRVINPGGRAGIISFHSLEDRRVKQQFKALADTGRFERITRKPATAGEEELVANPRSRSAKLRVLRRIDQAG